MKLGCEDCGAVYDRKADVPQQCQPYTYYVVRNEHTLGGYEFAGVEDPDWSRR